MAMISHSSVDLLTYLFFVDFPLNFGFDKLCHNTDLPTNLTNRK